MLDVLRNEWFKGWMTWWGRWLGTWQVRLLESFAQWLLGQLLIVCWIYKWLMDWFCSSDIGQRWESVWVSLPAASRWRSWSQTSTSTTNTPSFSAWRARSLNTHWKHRVCSPTNPHCVYVCVCVCVCKRGRERERMCVCDREREREGECVRERVTDNMCMCMSSALAHSHLPVPVCPNRGDGPAEGEPARAGQDCGRDWGAGLFRGQVPGVPGGDPAHGLQVSQICTRLAKFSVLSQQLSQFFAAFFSHSSLRKISRKPKFSRQWNVTVLIYSKNNCVLFVSASWCTALLCLTEAFCRTVEFMMKDHLFKDPLLLRPFCFLKHFPFLCK